MKPTLLLLPLLLAGCAATQTAWLNPGVEATRAERTFLGCEAQAQADFPRALERDWTAGTFTVGGRFCDGPFCLGTSTGLPRTTTRDANASLRTRSVELCMADAGYTKISVPQCPADLSPLELSRHPNSISGVCLTKGRFALAP